MQMKKQQKILMIAMTVLVLVLVCYIVFSFGLPLKTASHQPTTLKYHFVLVVENIKDPFWASLQKGALQAAADHNIAVEILGKGISESETQEKLFMVAVNSNVDGIITDVISEERYTELIEKATEKGIPVVTVNNDAPYSSRIAHIGVDNYEIGVELGKAVIQAIGSKGNIVLIVGVKEGYKIDPGQYLRIRGFNEYLAKYPDILLIREQYSDSGFLSSVEITRNTLKTYYSVNAIVSTTTMDTLGVAQVITEENLENSIKILGVEENDQIKDSILNGSIFGVVVTNPFEMGYKSVSALVQHIEDGKISIGDKTKIELLTKENVKR